MIDTALKVVKPGGHLFVSTNFTGISPSLLKEWVEKSAVQTKTRLKKIQSLGQDKDFRGSGSIRESHLAALLVGI